MGNTNTTMNALIERYPYIKSGVMLDLHKSLYKEVSYFYDDEDLQVISLIYHPFKNYTKTDIATIGCSIQVAEMLSLLNRIYLQDSTVLADLQANQNLISLYLLSIKHLVIPKGIDGISKDRAQYLLTLVDAISVSEITSDIEDHLFQIVHPDIYSSYNSHLATTRSQYFQLQKEFEHNLMQCFEEEHVNSNVQSRVKTVYSVYKKAKDKNILPSQVLDTMGIRIILSSKKECYRVMHIMLRNWSVISSKIKDYIAVPKENGYKSIHMTVIHKGYPVEIQIRTKAMHREAVYGAYAHQSYKIEGAHQTKQSDISPLVVNQKNSLDFSKSLNELITLHSIIDGMYHEFYVLDAESGVVLYANDRAKQNLGYSESEISNMTIMDICILMPDLSHWKRHLKDLHDQGDIVLRTQHRKKKGDVYPVKIHTSYRELDGKEFVIAMAEDYSSRLIQRTELDIFKKVFDFSTDCKFIFDLGTENVVNVNETALATFGIEKGDIEGSSISMVFRDLDFKQLRSDISSGKDYLEYEVSVVSKYGPAITCQIEFMPIGIGNAFYVMARFRTSSSVTYQIQPEMNDTNLQTFLESAPYFIIQTDLDGKIVYMNKVLPGLKINDVMGKYIYDFIPSEDSTIEDAMSFVVESKESIEVESEGTGGVGQASLYKTKISPVVELGEVASLMFICRDVSHERKTEERLKEAYKHLSIINRQVSILLNFGKATPENAGELIEHTLQSALRLSQAKIIALYKYDKPGKTFRMVSSLGLKQEEQKEIVNFDLADSDQVRQMLAERIRIQGIYRTAWSTKLKVVVRHKLKHYLLLPLMEGQEVLGMIFVSFADRPELTSQELDFYDVLAMQASYTLSAVLMSLTDHSLPLESSST